MRLTWQPVGTAPKDRTKIIGLNIIDHDMQVVYYDPNSSPRWTDGSSVGGGIHITHWLPLNVLPKSPYELYPEIEICAIERYSSHAYFIHLDGGKRIRIEQDIENKDISFSYITSNLEESYEKTYKLSSKWNGDLTETEFCSIFQSFLQDPNNKK